MQDVFSLESFNIYFSLGLALIPVRETAPMFPPVILIDHVKQGKISKE